MAVTPPPWTTLAALRPGAVFETRARERFVKTRFGTGADEWEAVSVCDGDTRILADCTEVREMRLYGRGRIRRYPDEPTEVPLGPPLTLCDRRTELEEDH